MPKECTGSDDDAPRMGTIPRWSPDEVVENILRNFCLPDHDKDGIAVSSTTWDLITTSLVSFQWRNVSQSLMRQYIYLGSYVDIIEFASVVMATKPELALQVRHLHTSFLSDPSLRFGVKEHSIASKALLNIFTVCKNIESLSTDAVTNLLEYKWALAIANLSELRYLSIDFDFDTYRFDMAGKARVNTGILSLFGCAKARHIILKGLASVRYEESSASTLVPSRQSSGPSPDLTPFRPPETRSIAFIHGYWISPEDMETIFDRLTQGRKISLRSVEIGALRAKDVLFSINLIGLLELFGSDLKKLKVDQSWRIDELSRLGSVCPGLEELDVLWEELNYWNPCDTFPESLKKVIVRFPERSEGQDPHIELFAHSSSHDGKLTRVFEVFKVSRYMTTSHTFELQNYLTKAGLRIRNVQWPQLDD